MSTLRTIKQMAERNPAFTQGSLRWIVFRASDKTDPDYSKFRPAIHRVSRRVLIDEPLFLSIATDQHA